MGIFGTILNYAEKVYDRVVGNDTASNSPAANGTQKSGKAGNATNPKPKKTNTPEKPNSTMNPSEKYVGTVGDVAVISGNNNNNNQENLKTNNKITKNTPQKPCRIKKELAPNIKGMQKTIEIACLKDSRIDYNLIMKCLPGIADLATEEQFKSLPENKQEMILQLVLGSIRRAETKSISKNSDLTQAILVDAKLKYDWIMKKGIFTSEGEMEALMKNSHIQNAINNLTNGIEELSPEEIDKREEEFYAAFELGLQEELKKLKNLPAPQRKVEEKKLREQFRAMKEQIFVNMLPEYDTETSLELMSIVDQKDFGKASGYLLKTRKTDAERIRCANKADFEFLQRKACLYHKIGNDLKGDAIKEYNINTVSWKTNDAVTKYQADYMASRKDPNRPEYMTEEIYTATAVGIGVGATINVNMSVQQKAEFLHNWELDAQKFSDYDEVVTSVDNAINEYIGKNPEAAKMIKDIHECRNKLVKEIVDKTKLKKSEHTTYSTTEENQPAKNGSKESKSFATDPINNPKTEEKTPDGKNKSMSELKKSSEQKLLAKLNSGEVTLNEAVSAFGENKAYKVLFSNSQLLTKYEKEAIDYITNQRKVEDLVKLANSGKAIELILKYNRVENKEILYKELEDKATSVQKYMFKDKMNEAA